MKCVAILWQIVGASKYQFKNWIVFVLGNLMNILSKIPIILYALSFYHQVFVANPNKPKPILDILLRNREKVRNVKFIRYIQGDTITRMIKKTWVIYWFSKYFLNFLQLIDFLSNFHNDRNDDEQFNDEKAYLIKQVSYP